MLRAVHSLVTSAVSAAFGKAADIAYAASLRFLDLSYRTGLVARAAAPVPPMAFRAPRTVAPVPPEPDDEPSVYDVREALAREARSVVAIPDRCPALVLVDVDEDLADLAAA